MTSGLSPVSRSREMTSRGAGEGPRPTCSGLPSGQGHWRKPSLLSLSGSVPCPGFLSQLTSDLVLDK